MVCLLLCYLQIVPIHSGSSDELLMESKKNLGEVLRGVAQWIMFTLKCENQYSGPPTFGRQRHGICWQEVPSSPLPCLSSNWWGQGVGVVHLKPRFSPLSLSSFLLSCSHSLPSPPQFQG